jgi:hypothetical protein
VNTRRLELLNAYENGDGGPAVEPILDALMRPIFEFGTTRECLPQLMVRLLYLDAKETSRVVFATQFKEVIPRFQAAFGRALPHLAPAELMMRMQFVAGALASALASMKNLHALAEGPSESSDSGKILQRLIQFTAVGMKAPAAEDTACES